MEEVKPRETILVAPLIIDWSLWTANLSKHTLITDFVSSWSEVAFRHILRQITSKYKSFRHKLCLSVQNRFAGVPIPES
jgi:hypothetical protein